MWDLLRQPTIRTIWLGETVNSLGSGLTFWALAWLLYRRFPEQPWLAASVLAAQGVGTMLGTAGLGAYLDHWDRRRTLVAVNLILAALTALVPTLADASLVLPMVLVSFAQGVVSSLSMPALSATLPSFVPLPRVQHIQALFNLTWMTAGLIAPALSGYLISSLGAGRVLYVDALTFVAVAVAYTSVRFPPQPALEEAGLTLRAWWAQVRAGVGFFRSRPLLWGTMIGIAGVNALFETFFGIFVPRLSDRLMRGVALPAWLGSDTGAVGLGLFDTVVVILETLTSLYIGSRAAFADAVALRLILAGCLGPMLGALVVVFAPNLGVALIGCAVQGACVALVSALWGPLFARTVPEELRGRVSSVRFFVGNSVRPALTLASSALLPVLGLGSAALVLVGVLAGAALYGHARAVRDG